MISSTLRGRYEGGVREAVTTLSVQGAAVKFTSNVTEATFVNGSFAHGLSFSVEKPGSFLIDYDVPKQDVRFQFINNGIVYVHRDLTTFEPSYDFAKNSWDVAVSQRVYEDNVVKASYQNSSKVLALEWSKNPNSSGGFQISASVNLAEESKFPTLSVDSRLHVEL
ncbi:hypothetical protein HAX54_050774 [Datura stramonium]|uniref:Uncharacterized protein n=1 Tax=Datura stramonium TaxID=4076 RepID=A0ABS8SXJ3_DATST|nr:hypothetical protein [Datura stramonium]